MVSNTASLTDGYFIKVNVHNVNVQFLAYRKW